MILYGDTPAERATRLLDAPEEWSPEVRPTGAKTPHEVLKGYREALLFDPFLTLLALKYFPVSLRRLACRLTNQMAMPVELAVARSGLPLPGPLPTAF